MIIEYKTINKSDSKLMKLIGKILKPICPEFMTDYYTTLGKTIYLPLNTEKINEVTLNHELVHVEQYNKYSILYYFSYLFLLPSVFTMRSYWEKKAYSETIRSALIKYKHNFDKERLKKSIVEEFTCSFYLWMCPFKKHMENWFEKELEKIKNETNKM